MKKFLFNAVLVFILMLSGGLALAQPTFSYTGSPYTLSVGTPATITPVGAASVTGGYAPPVNFAAINGVTDVVYSSTAGAFFAVDINDGYLYKISTTGTVTLLNTADLYEPNSIAVDGLGNLWVADQYNGYVYRMSPTTGAVLTSIYTNKTIPTGIAVDASNNVYFTDQYYSRVYKIAASTYTKTTLLTGFNAPSGIAISGNNMFVAQQGTNTIIEIANAVTGSTTKTTFASGFNAPNNMRFNTNGYLYVADQGSNTIKAISTTGTVSTILTGLNQPSGLTFDASNNLYEADYGTNEVKKSTFTYWTISAALPSGLSFNTSTGVISGTPTVVSAATNYTITGYNTTGSLAVTISIACQSAPALTYNTTNVFTVGLSATLTPTNTGGTPAGCTIVSVPSGTTLASVGLAISATGVITGIPSTTLGTTTFVVTATNGAGNTNSNNFTIKIVSPPVFSYGGPYTFTQGTGITTVTPSITSGGPIASYAISPTLPTGLIFSTTAGTISGTPSVVSTATNYTITATSTTGGIGTATVNITVNPSAPTIAYSGSPFTYTVGTTISSLTPATTNSPTSYSISPNIATNTGLTFSTSTGVISGIPTIASTPVTYTITATNPAGNGTTTISVQVNYPASPTISYTGSPFTYTVGTAITTLTPVVTGSPTSYSISPALPAGLSLSTTNGQISGNPTATSASTVYIISAFNGNPTPGTTNITILVNPKAPAISYTTPDVYTVGTPVTLTPTNTGGTATWAVTSGTLPSYFTLNTSTGVITGTPTSYLAATNYTITATNVTGSSNKVINITVNQAPVIAYSPNSYTFTVSTAIPNSIIPTNSGSPVSAPGAFGAGTVLSGTNTPAGVAIDKSGNLYAADYGTARVLKYTNATGTPVNFGPVFSIPVGVAVNGSGNVYVLDAGTNLVTKYNSSGTAQPFTSPTFNFAVAIAVDPNGNVYVADIGANAIYGITPTGTVFETITTNVNSPTGIAVDASGNIYVLNNSGFGNPTVTKYNSGGTYVSSTTLSATLDPNAIAIDGAGNIYIGDSNNGQVLEYNSAGTRITAATVTGFSDPVGIVVDSKGDLFVSDDGNGIITKFAPTSGYTVNGPLPAGITFNTTTGQFSGTPTQGFASTTYTVTAYNSTGSGSTTVTFSCNTPAPIISYSPSTNVYTVGTAITTLIPLSTGGPVTSYSINTALPAGLTFNPNNGYISGTPTVTSLITIYTIIATNSGGTYSTTVTITVNPKPPVITYNTPQTFGIGQTVSISPTSTGGPVSGYSVSPALPGGLAINSTSGLISGTTTTATAAANYVVTATNVGGTGTFTINITVIGQPAISYTPAVSTLPVNVTITPLTPANTGGTITPSSFGTGVSLTSGSLSNPWGMFVDASNNIYVVNYGSANIIKYLAATNYTTSSVISIASANNPTGVAVDNTGEIYVVYSSGYVYKYPSTGGTGTLVTSTIYNYSFTSNGYAIAIDASKNLYIADENSGIIWKSTNGSGVTATKVVAKGTTGITNPAGVAVDASGNIYVVDITTNELNKYNSSGVFQNTIVSGLSNPYSLYIDASGNFYIGDPGSGKVSEYNPSGTLLCSITGLTNPRGLVTDPAGNLYVSDYSNNTVKAYPPNYYVLSGGALPTGLSFSGVTGTFSGTPTVSPFGPVVYTITAHGYLGSPVSTTETISCFTSYDWAGATSTDWNNAANWESKVIPTSTSAVSIGVNYPFTNQPFVESAAASAASLTFGNKGGKAPILTVNNTFTLTVSGDINQQSDANSTLGYTSTLTGPGTIKAVNLNVIANTAAASAYTESITSSVTSLQLSGNVSLTSNFATTAENASFKVTGGVTSLTGTGATGIISTTNQAGSTSTIAVSAGTLQWANATGLSGLSATGTNTLALTGTGVIGYSGANQTVYTDLPITGLSGGVSYQGISFSGTGIKTPNGTVANNLNIAGSFTNTLANDAGDNVALTNTVVNFNGTTAQALAGGVASQTYGTIFNTVNFSNAGTKTMSGNFYVAPTGTLTLSSGAPLVAGDANTSPTTADGYLTLLSNSAGSAAVAPITSGSITGNVNVQRYVSPDRGYRLMSSPVYAGTDASSNKIYSVNYLINKMYVTGTGTGFTATGNPTLFLYDEGFVPQYTTFFNSNFVAISSLSSGTGATPTYPLNTNGAGIASTNIPVGNGYYNFYRGNLSEGANITNPSYTALPDTITATGTLTQGQVIVKDWYSPSSSYLGAVSQNLNLIGNPYASAIDLSTVPTATTTSGVYMTPYNGTSGVSKFIYELNPVTGIYGQYIDDGSLPPTNGATQYIASGQAFFVQAFGANYSQVIFNEDGKATATNATVPGLMVSRHVLAAAVNTGNINPLLRLKMTLDSVHNEESLLTFNPAFKAQYVFNEDAPHKKGAGLVGFSSTSSDNIDMAVNALPLLQTQTIPLNVYATNDGLYTIGLEQLHQLPNLYDIWLMDAYKKDSLDIKHNPVYSFNVLNADTNSFGTKRFTLVIRQNPALMVHLLSFAVNKVTPGDQVVWTTENEQNYTNFAVQRSTDGGKTFTILDGLTSSGQGTYTFLDKNPVIGANSYRLQLTDLNGTISYSNIVTIMYANTGNQIAINGFMLYPNPTSSTVNLAIDQSTVTQTAGSAAVSYNIKIINNLGSVIKTAVSSQPDWQADVSTLVPGTYFVLVTNASTNSVVGKSAFVKL